jgi:hypothetical protein
LIQKPITGLKSHWSAVCWVLARTGSTKCDAYLSFALECVALLIGLYRFLIGAVDSGLVACTCQASRPSHLSAREVSFVCYKPHLQEYVDRASPECGYGPIGCSDSPSLRLSSTIVVALQCVHIRFGLTITPGFICYLFWLYYDVLSWPNHRSNHERCVAWKTTASQAQLFELHLLQEGQSEGDTICIHSHQNELTVNSVYHSVAL